MPARSQFASDPDGRSSAARYMLGALQTAHQHADAKAGILAAAQAALVGTAHAWVAPLAQAVDRRGAAGLLAAAALGIFACALLGGVVCLTCALRPRLPRSTTTNRYNFVSLAADAGVPGGEHPTGPRQPAQANAAAAGTFDQAADRQELSEAVRSLAGIALVKFRCLTGAVVCTTLMATVAGLCVILRPVLA